MKTRIAVGLGSSVVLCVAITLLFAADGNKADEAFQGTWKLVAGEANGTALSEKQLQGGSLIIKGDQYTVTLNGETITGIQKLDSTESIKTIDITDANGAHKGQTCLGIYELQGDEFRVAFAAPGKARPSKMSTTADSGLWVHVWKRVK